MPLPTLLYALGTFWGFMLKAKTLDLLFQPSYGFFAGFLCERISMSIILKKKHVTDKTDNLKIQSILL